MNKYLIVNQDTGEVIAKEGDTFSAEVAAQLAVTEHLGIALETERDVPNLEETLPMDFTPGVVYEPSSGEELLKVGDVVTWNTVNCVLEAFRFLQDFSGGSEVAEDEADDSIPMRLRHRGVTVLYGENFEDDEYQDWGDQTIEAICEVLSVADRLGWKTTLIFRHRAIQGTFQMNRVNGSCYVVYGAKDAPIYDIPDFFSGDEEQLPTDARCRFMREDIEEIAVEFGSLKITLVG